MTSYNEPQQFAAEQATIQRHPAILAPTPLQVRRPGDFITDLTTGRNLIIARGHDGHVRGSSTSVAIEAHSSSPGPRGAGVKCFVAHTTRGRTTSKGT